jgi:hypothetical protein
MILWGGTITSVTEVDVTPSATTVSGCRDLNTYCRDLCASSRSKSLSYEEDLDLVEYDR